MTENIKRQNGNAKNNKETCPVCGFRTRYPENLLCPQCNKKYVEDSATALANGQTLVNRLEFVETEGPKTLARLMQKQKEIEAEKDNQRQMLWEQSSKQIIANLRAQEARVGPEVRHQAKVQLFRTLRDSDEKHQELAKKAYGLKKAVDSLIKLLAELKEKRKEYEREQTEKQLSEEAQVLEVTT